jgi:hypothetical protein
LKKYLAFLKLGCWMLASTSLDVDLI